MKQSMVLIIAGVFVLGFVLPGIPQSNQTNFGGNGSGVSTVSGTAPIVSSGGATPAISCPTCATTTNGGALSGTAPVTISAAGAVGCATCTTSAAALTSNSVVLGGGGQAESTQTFLTTNGTTTLTVGVAAGGNGVLALAGNTSGTATLTAPATAGTTTNAVVSSNVMQGPVGSAASPTFQTATNVHGFYNSGGFLGIVVGGTDALYGGSSGDTWRLRSSAVFGWSPGTTLSTAPDTALGRAGVGMITTFASTLKTANSVFVTANFTTSGVGTALENITGLSWTFGATAANWPFHCHLSYLQNTGNAAVAFGIQSNTNSPTNIFANGTQQITVGPPATIVTGTLATLTTTTATNIVSGTPTATATNYIADLYGMLELPASAHTVNLMTSTATAADTVTVLRGSYCSLNP